jgi:ribokinase
MSGTPLRLPAEPPYRRLVGVGGIGSGMFLALEGDGTLGRTESRAARVLDVHDYCKLHTVAHHVATLGGLAVVPVGVVGDDEVARRLVEELREAGMDVEHIRVDADKPTLFSVCFQYPDGEGGNITTADSAASAFTVADVEDVASMLDERTIALAQPEVPLEPRRRLLELARERGALTAGSFTTQELDDARACGLFPLMDVVAINEHEASALAGTPFDPADAEPALRACASAFGDDIRLVVTAGAHGAFAVEGSAWGHRPAPVVEVASTAGSGDALLAGVLVGLAAGAPLLGTAHAPEIDDALGLGVLLGSLNATSQHTIHPSADADALAAFARETGLRPVGPLATLFEEDAR